VRVPDGAKLPPDGASLIDLDVRANYTSRPGSSRSFSRLQNFCQTTTPSAATGRAICVNTNGAAEPSPRSCCTAVRGLRQRAMDPFAGFGDPQLTRQR
jgi:hypothetical protein